MNTALIAVAGAGKTTMLAKAVSNEPRPSKIAVLTYTTTNQIEDAMRIASTTSTSTAPRIMGWCAFLLNEVVRPYLPYLYRSIKISGLAMSDPKSFQYLKGASRYISKNGLVYPSTWANSHSM